VNWRDVVAVLLVALAVFGVPNVPSFERHQDSVVEPTKEMKKTVQPVVKVVASMSAIDRLWLKHIYENAATVMDIDAEIGDPVVATTSGLRGFHVAILKFIWAGLAGNPPGKYEDLQEAIDTVMNEVIGDEHKSLTPEMRQKAAEVFRAIAWAGLGKE
jgi:hypothetical protein